MAFHLLKNAITIFCYTTITQLFDFTYYVSLHNYQYIHPSALGIPNFKYFQSMSSISFSLVSLGFFVVQVLFCSIFFHLFQMLFPSFARQCPASGINWLTALLISPFLVFIVAVFPSSPLITPYVPLFSPSVFLTNTRSPR